MLELILQKQVHGQVKPIGSMVVKEALLVCLE